MLNHDFEFLLPKQSWSQYLRSREQRRKLEILVRDLNAVTRQRLVEDKMRHLVLYGFDGNSNLINVYGYPEREVMDLIFRYLALNNLIRDAALDVGANVGMHAIRFAKYFCRVFAFEPHPETFALLRTNLRHYAPDAQAFQIAAGSTTGTSTLYENKLQNMGAPSLTKSETVFAEHEIKIDRLDNLSDLRGIPIGLMKVDTEGHELGVFQGAVELIRANRPVLLFEDWASGKGVESEVVKFVRTLGYNDFLVPDVYPLPHASRIVRLLQILRRGSSLGIRRCDFSSARGYELIIALPDRTGSHAK